MLTRSGVTCECRTCKELITTGDHKFTYGKRIYCFKCGFGKKKVLLKEIPYEMQFYWKGKRYKQIIRPKNPKGKFVVVCYPVKEPCSDYINMPAGRIIKPVITVNYKKQKEDK